MTPAQIRDRLLEGRLYRVAGSVSIPGTDVPAQRFNRVLRFDGEGRTGPYASQMMIRFTHLETGRKVVYKLDEIETVMPL